jgi:hypothetical protein
MSVGIYIIFTTGLDSKRLKDVILEYVLYMNFRFIILVLLVIFQFLHIRIEIIHGSHMYILFLPQVGFYVSFLPLANARGKTS